MGGSWGQAQGSGGDPQGVAGRGLTPPWIQSWGPEAKYGLGSLGGSGERGEILLVQCGELVRQDHINKGTKARLTEEKGLLCVNLVRARLGLRGRFTDSKKKPSLNGLGIGEGTATK